MNMCVTFDNKILFFPPNNNIKIIYNYFNTIIIIDYF